MDRRAMLAAAAIAIAAGPVRAQSDNRTNTQTSPALGAAEKTHAEKTATIGTASLTMANLALEKAHGEKVKEFAKFERDEQTTVAAILKTMDPGLTPANPPQGVAEAIDKLKNARGGETFDREFVSAQIQGHEMLRTIQEEYLKEGKDQGTINVTTLVLGMINEHLTLLSDLKRSRESEL
jgi:putative membrane protein